MYTFVYVLMSEAEREISEVSGGVADGNDDGHLDAGGAVTHTCRIDFDGRPCKRDLEGKVKQVLLFPFAKSRKKKQIKTRAKLSSLPSSGKRVGGGGGVCSGFLCLQPCALESPPNSRTSESNDPNFTYEMLKALIEGNHFYTKECNPHSV
ncbi:hypothetical protein CCACVL1_09741 [Corchorus capsularis]|uniref:Uncharacterized protein n=1 Tax=Corchorus capsularis TaxID=210143 RepID=A0A1R3IUC7_COCAP|nr:hypothetical protein CCACVL1_09741 [Corchorus capsularis]